MPAIEGSYERYTRGEVWRSRARETGGEVLLLDAEVAPDYQPEEGGRWVTFCVDHGTFVQHETRRIAASFLPCPSEWCEGCRS